MSIKTASFAALLIASAAPAPAHAADKPNAPGTKLICRDIDEIGSRLRSHRTCLTKEQWDAQRREVQDEISQGQKRLLTACPPKTVCG